MDFIFWVILLELVTGTIGWSIGESTNKGGLGFILGFLFSVFGIIMILCIRGDEKRKGEFSKYEKLEKLQMLKEKGVITESQFEEERKILLKS